MPEIPLFPAEPLIKVGYSVHKKPTFASIVSSPTSGREVTGYQMPYPLWEFELSYEVLRDQGKNPSPFSDVLGYTEMQTLSEFWLLLNAQYGTFIYQDPDDYSRQGQLIGVGDGTTKAFLLRRTWGFAPYAVSEPIGIADVRVGVTFNVYIDGIIIPQAGSWWIDTDLRTLKFVTPPPNLKNITADFSFFYYCRFLEDTLDLEEFAYGWWRVASLKFRSTLPDPAPPPGSLIFTPKHIPDEDPIITTPQDDLPPDQEAWLFAPSFGTAIGAPYIGNLWGDQRSDVDTGFPSNLIGVLAGNVTLPNTGSFRVTCRTFFTRFIVSTYTITACWMRVVFSNSTLPPLETSSIGFVPSPDITNTDQFLEVTMDRADVAASKIDPMQPIVIHMEIRCDGTTGIGGGNIFPSANITNDSEPFHDGDASLIVDWWAT